MKKYFIKKLTISGENKTTSYIEFNDGLNIVYGVSDTGKTCILKCIDFVFGSQENEPIPKIHGYSNVKLDIVTTNGKVSLERVIGKNKVNVISTDDHVISGTYDIKELGKNLIGLIGIVDKPMIIKNKRYERAHLTWRSIMHSFVINEDEIIQSEPILITKENTAKTASLSALLYLISAPDFSKFDEKEDKKIKEVRKKAVEKYIYKEISYLKEQKMLLQKQLENSDISNTENEIQDLVDELEVIESKITNEINISKNLLSQIIDLKDQIAQFDLLLSRYLNLRTQYNADIKRLSFIVDGENKLDKIPTAEKCPFCNGELHLKNDVSYIEAANAELNRIILLLKDLDSTEKTVIEDKSFAQEKLVLMCNEKNNIDNFIQTELKPKALNLKKSIDCYKRMISIEMALSTFDDLQIKKSHDLEEILTKEEEKIIEYRPKEHYPSDFEDEIGLILENLLKECQYENYVSSSFSLDDFDVFINSKSKRNFGKGMKAMINSIVAVTFRKYLYEKGEFYSSFIILDSPLVSFEQGVPDEAPESMKMALMNYLMNNQEIGQTIIIENRIPELNYDEKNVTMHNFTKGKSQGRYGLLADVTE